MGVKLERDPESGRIVVTDSNGITWPYDTQRHMTTERRETAQQSDTLPAWQALGMIKGVRVRDKRGVADPGGGHRVPDRGDPDGHTDGE